MALIKRVSLLNLALPSVPTIQNDENFVEFTRIYNAIKLLASAVDMMQATAIATATEDIPFGAFVNLYNDGGSLAARLANSTASKPAHGFCLTQDLTAGDSAEFLLQGVHPGFAGLTIGQRYFLGTGGLVTATPPSSGIQQALGVAISESTMWVQCVIDYLGS